MKVVSFKPFFSILQIDFLNFKSLVFVAEPCLKKKLKASDCCLRGTKCHQLIKIDFLWKPRHALSIRPALCFDTETRCLSVKISYSLESIILNFWVLNFMQLFISKITENSFLNDSLMPKEVPIL
jgi:hypothetical protein